MKHVVFCRSSCCQFEQKQHGFVVLAIVVALVLVAAIGLMMTTETALEADLTSRSTEVIEVEYVAQAALEHALWQNSANVCSGDIAITDTLLDGHSYSAIIDAAGTATEYTATVDADARILESSPDQNFGGDSELSVVNKAGDSSHALIHFDTSSIPTGTKIQTAEAWIYVTRNDADAALEVRALTTSWAESTVTWNAVSADIDPGLLGTIPPQETPNVWVNIGITGLVQQWVSDPTANYGIVLSATSAGLESKYASRELGGGYGAYLVVTGSNEDLSPVTVTATGMHASGVKRSLIRESERVYQQPRTIIVQPDGSAGRDVWIDSKKARWSRGTNADLSADESGITRALLAFDGLSVPMGTKVVAATLELWAASALSGNEVSVHRMTSNWVEGNCAGKCTGEGATWNTSDGTNAWQSAGGDYEAQPLATTSTPNPDTWYSWDVTEAVSAWLSGETPNYGLMLRGTVGGTVFDSSDGLDPAHFPKLSIEYSCECGSPCIAPSGSGNVLMTVGNSGALTTEDETAKALMESWGYTITLIDDDSSQTAFSDASNVNDVLYVAGSVNPPAVGTKLSGLGIGIVNSVGELSDELGFATSAAWGTLETIDLVAVDHYITHPFAAGSLDIYGNRLEAAELAGTVSPDLKALANSGSAVVLGALDTGAMLASGGNAPARRVMLPFGREGTSNFGFGHFNNNGLLILQRSLAWASGVM